MRFDRDVTTTCGYCGVGCRLEAHALDGRVVSISPALDGPANKGHTCLKGRFAHGFTRKRERLRAPLIRTPGGDLRSASWDEAIALIVSELTRIRELAGPDAIAGLASSRATNEDCYVMQRMMRAAIGTHNIDNCSRVCHSPTSWALRQSLGLSGATGSFDDIEAADAAILIGANPTEGHPVAGARIKQATLRGLKLVTIDPRRIELSDYAVLHLSPRPGSNAAVMLGLAHVVARDGLVDDAFLRVRTEGWPEVEDLLADYTPLDVQRISGIAAADIEAAAHVYAEAADACVLWGLGVTEHKYGSEVVRLICNLALMCGKLGRPGSALLPLRGQNNVQGSSDMGALPDTFTGYQSVADEDVARRFEARWGVRMKRDRGLKIPEMFDAAIRGDLKAMYIFGEDVAQTDPNTTHVIKALQSLELLVVQDIFENETTKYADVILPASSFLEKSGTFTNAERRIQLVDAAVSPPGDARTDFHILTTLSAALGHDMGFATPADVMDEVAELTPDWAGVSHERLGRRGLQWPVAADGTDSPILYRERFELPGGRARMAALPYKPPGSEVSEEFPIVLVTGRRLEHYNAGTMTRRTANLDLVPGDWLEIHPDDARRLWVTDGDLVSVRSAHGRIELPARVTARIDPGHVFTAFHFPEIRTNLLVGPSADVNTSCPEYKVVAVDVRPVAEQPSQTPAIAAAP
ncbi:MAG TPA: formate dehydrogenase subunit alpha [Solirubrobacteraceae bacterium]